MSKTQMCKPYALIVNQLISLSNYPKITNKAILLLVCVCDQ